MELIFKFTEYLNSLTKKPSKVTIKNYKSDLLKFINWFEQEFGKEFDPSLVNLHVLQAYKQAKNLEGFSASSLERQTSSLRKFFNYLALEGVIGKSPLEQPDKFESQLKEDPWHLKNYKNYLYVYNASNLTIKNYIIDIKQFLSWVSEVAFAKDSYIVDKTNVLDRIDEVLIAEYRRRLLNDSGLSAPSINRKLSSLRKYLAWAQAEGHIRDFDHRAATGNDPHPIIKSIKSLVSPEYLVIEKKDELPLEKEGKHHQLNDSFLAETNKEIKRTKTYSRIPPIRLFQ